MSNYLLLNMPNPPNRNIYRAFAGGFGTLGLSSKDDMLFPIYLLYASSAMEYFGLDYNAIDAQALNYDSKKVIELVNKDPPDVLIALPSLPALKDDLRLLSEIKEVRPEILIIALGTVCNVLTEEILRSSRVDLVVKGYYPYYKVVAGIVENLENGKAHDKIPTAAYWHNNEIINNPLSPYKEELDRLDLKAYHKLPVKKYVTRFLDSSGSWIECIPILTGVGCSYGCIYCPYPLGYGRSMVNKSNEKVIEEIEFIVDNFDVNGFVFREQTFTYDKKRVYDLCDRIIEKKLEINWLIETRIDLVDERLLKKMREAGCFRIHYGVETGDEKILRTQGKPGSSLKQHRKAFSDSKKAGIYTHAHMMIGFQEDDEETIEKSIKLLREINPDRVNINMVTPYPGTKLYEIAKREGLILTNDWSRYTSYDPIMRTKALGPEELIKARKKMKREFIKFKILKDPTFRAEFLRSLPGKIISHLS
jgi:radical SAM superfamily enzyme YgiQ (UPF0313 family)